VGVGRSAGACLLLPTIWLACGLPAVAGVLKPPEEFFKIPRGPAYYQPMTFAFERDPLGQELVFGTGMIVKETAASLARFAEQWGIQRGATIYFHSSGGEADSAMALGRYIRQQSFQTSVGRQMEATRRRHPFGSDADSGVCVGPCTLAFLGGYFRSVPKGSFYDVFQTDTDLEHKHYFDKGTFIAQKWSAAIGAYLAEMSIDLVFFQYATLPLSTKKGRTHYIPDARELHQWNVTSDAQATHWGVEIRDKKFWLVGANPRSPFMRDANNEIAFGCAAPHLMVMQVAYLPSGLFLPSSVDKYGLVRWISPVDDHDIPAGKEETGDLTIDTGWLWSKFEISASDGRVRGQIVLRPEIIDFLRRTDILSIQFYTSAGWPGQFQIEFSAGNELFMEFIKAPCI
jgi:hypothetical protein